MGATYETIEGCPAVQVELTAGQILSLKDKEYIDVIDEEVYVTLDNTELAMRGGDSIAAAGAPAIADRAKSAGEKNEEGRSPFGYLLLLPVLAAGGSVLILARRKRNGTSGNGQYG